MPGEPGRRTIHDRDAIAARVAALGAAISADYVGRDLVVVGVLKGAFVFMADLVRAIDLPLTCDFVRASSYGDATTSSGDVRIEFDTTQPIEGKDVLVVEDIVDTGLTARAILAHLQAHGPRTLALATLLLKPDNVRGEDLEIAYVGFEIPPDFVIGYGMDVMGAYRNLPEILLYEQ